MAVKSAEIAKDKWKENMKAGLLKDYYMDADKLVQTLVESFRLNIPYIIGLEGEGVGPHALLGIGFEPTNPDLPYKNGSIVQYRKQAHQLLDAFYKNYPEFTC